MAISQSGVISHRKDSDTDAFGNQQKQKQTLDASDALYGRPSATRYKILTRQQRKISLLIYVTGEGGDGIINYPQSPFASTATLWTLFTFLMRPPPHPRRFEEVKKRQVLAAGVVRDALVNLPLNIQVCRLAKRTCVITNDTLNQPLTRTQTLKSTT